MDRLLKIIAMAIFLSFLSPALLLFLSPSPFRKESRVCRAAPASFHRRETRTGFYGRLFTIEVMRKAGAAASSTRAPPPARSARGLHRPPNANYANYVTWDSCRITINARSRAERPRAFVGTQSQGSTGPKWQFCRCKKRKCETRCESRRAVNRQPLIRGHANDHPNEHPPYDALRSYWRIHRPITASIPISGNAGSARDSAMHSLDGACQIYQIWIANTVSRVMRVTCNTNN